MTMDEAGAERHVSLDAAIPDPAGFVERLAEILADDLPPSRRPGEPLAFALYGARARVELTGAGTAVRLVVDAVSADRGALANMQHFLARVATDWAGADAAIRWTGEGSRARALPQLCPLRVVAATAVTPRLRRLRLAGDDLARFATNGLHVQLLIPPAGRAPFWPVAAPSGIPIYPTGADALTVRSYTIRRIDPASGHLDIDVVLHEGTSPGADFALRARAGDPVAMMGPGGGGALPAARQLVAGDETALPAIARMLEEMPADARGAALIEVADGDEIQPLAHPPGVALRWLPRDGAPAGTTTLIEDAMREIAWAGEPGVSVWVGCEFDAFRRIRALCRETWCRPRGSHLVVAYWRRGGHF